MKTGMWFRSLLLIVVALAAFLGGRRLGLLQGARHHSASFGLPPDLLRGCAESHSHAFRSVPP